MQELKQKKLFNEHGERDKTQSRLINGNTTNMIEFNNAKYEYFTKWYRQSMNNFWIPEEVSLSQDAKDYDMLSERERFAYDHVICFLVFLDSIQTHNLPNINEWITDPIANVCLTLHTADEAIHSQSYSYILDTVVDAKKRDEIYNLWRENPNLMKRNKFIADLYEEFINNPNLKQFVKTVMANYILEGLYFYSGFAFFYSLGRQGKMLGTCTEIKFIQRDELMHLGLFEQIFRILKEEIADIFTPDFIQELQQMVSDAVDTEIEWGKYISNNEIPSLTDENIEKYIKYLGNTRLSRLGIPILYPEVKENPLSWVDQFSGLNSIKTDFFEQKVTNYQKGIKDDL